MVIDFALALIAAVDAGTVKTDFRGIVVGDAWVDGVSSVDSWGPFLLVARGVAPAHSVLFGAVVGHARSPACWLVTARASTHSACGV